MKHRTSQRRGNRAFAAATALILAVAALAKYCHARTSAAAVSPAQMIDSAGQDYYADAFSLIDLPTEDLAKSLPELAGLAAAQNQQQLPALLGRMGQAVEQAYQKFTEVIADEKVTQEHCGSGHQKTTTRQEFSYLIVPREQEGRERIDEYRVRLDGKPLEASDAGVRFGEGYAAMWALFYPGNQAGSRFRYLGEQQLDGAATYVLGFAQRPGWSTVMGYENTGLAGERVLVLYQGVVWIDKGTNRILKMRADLLKPRLDVKLEMQTTEIQFGEVHVSDAAATALWVPLQVTVTTVWTGEVFRDEHIYSKYRLPGANSRILPQGNS